MVCLPTEINKIGIIVAMENEAQATINHYGLKKILSKATIDIYGREDEKIFVSLNGKCPRLGVDNIGTNAAVLNTYILCEEIKPDIIINAGTAGGFIRKGSNIGDVYIGSERAVFHDRRIPLPNYDEYGLGNYLLFNTNTISDKLKLKKGIISTGNSLDFTQRDLEILLENNASLKDMEAASIAWVCELLNKPFLALKAVTDLVDNEIDTSQEFQQNFSLACVNLNRKLIDLIDFLIDNPASMTRNHSL